MVAPPSCVGAKRVVAPPSPGTPKGGGNTTPWELKGCWCVPPPPWTLKVVAPPPPACDLKGDGSITLWDLQGGGATHLHGATISETLKAVAPTLLEP